MFFWVGSTLLATLTGGCVPERGTIGALLVQRPSGQLFVRATPSGLAANRDGLAPGDQILLIDGRDVRRMDERAVHEALAGDVGSHVKLTVVRGESVLHVILTLTPAEHARARSAAP